MIWGRSGILTVRSENGRALKYIVLELKSFLFFGEIKKQTFFSVTLNDSV
jgi:hypothetical protein